MKGDLLNIQKEADMEQAELNEAKGRHDIFAEIAALGDRQLHGYDTGYKTINKHTRGLRGFTVLAGAANTGKTTLAINILYNIATGKRTGLPHNADATSKDGAPLILFFSFDMSKADIGRRLGQIFLQSDFSNLQANNRKEAYKNIEARFFTYDSKTIEAYKKQADLPEAGRQATTDVIKQLIAERVGESKQGVIVCIDYFHCLLTETLRDGNSTTDAERALVDSMIEISDMPGVECLLVISEKRKTTTSDAGNRALSIDELMGSARLGYAPDFVIGIQPDEILDARAGIKYALTDEASDRYSLLVYQCLKARDGGQRSNFRQRDYIIFDYRKNQLDFVRMMDGKPASLENKEHQPVSLWNENDTCNTATTIGGVFAECETAQAGKQNKKQADVSANPNPTF